MAKNRSRKKRALEAGMPDEQYMLIGSVITEWARLEAVLATLIWHFLKLDMEDGRVVTSTMEARPKIRMLRQLGERHIKPKPLKKQFIDLLEMTEEVSEDRNFIAHGLWGTAMPDNVPAAASFRPKANPFHLKTEPFSKGRMQHIISAITDLTEVFSEFPSALSASQKRHAARLHLLKTSRKLTQKDRTS